MPGVTPGGSSVCKYCGRWMTPGVNYCYAGVCMCGESDNQHGFIQDHGYVDAGEYNKLECEAEDG